MMVLKHVFHVPSFSYFQFVPTTPGAKSIASSKELLFCRCLITDPNVADAVRNLSGSKTENLFDSHAVTAGVSVNIPVSQHNFDA